MDESDFLESIKKLATYYKENDKGKNPLSWKDATYRVLYSIESGMVADALWLSRKKVDIKKSTADGEWEDDQVSVEIAKIFFRLYLEKYKNLEELEKLIKLKFDESEGNLWQKKK